MGETLIDKKLREIREDIDQIKGMVDIEKIMEAIGNVAPAEQVDLTPIKEDMKNISERVESCEMTVESLRKDIDNWNGILKDINVSIENLQSAVVEIQEHPSIKVLEEEPPVTE